MITVKEYALSHDVSTQAVYKMLQTHKDELKTHIVKEGKTRYLTDQAVEILEKYRATNQVVIKKIEDTQQIEALQRQIAELQAKVLLQSEELVEAYKKIADQSKVLGQIEERDMYHQKQIIDLKIQLEEERKPKSIFQRIFGSKK